MPDVENAWAWLTEARPPLQAVVTFGKTKIRYFQNGTHTFNTEKYQSVLTQSSTLESETLVSAVLSPFSIVQGRYAFLSVCCFAF